MNGTYGGRSSGSRNRGGASSGSSSRPLDWRTAGAEAWVGRPGGDGFVAESVLARGDDLECLVGVSVICLGKRLNTQGKWTRNMMGGVENVNTPYARHPFKFFIQRFGNFFEFRIQET